MNSLVKKIGKDIFTKREVLMRLAELKMAAQEHFFGKKELDLGQEAFLEGLNRDNLEETFKQAEAEINGARELTVYLAFVPEEKKIAKIGGKARSLFGESLFLDFKLDGKLIAGAALAFGGVYKDYSLRAKFEEKKEEIKKVYLSHLSDLRNL